VVPSFLPWKEFPTFGAWICVSENSSTSLVPYETNSILADGFVCLFGCLFIHSFIHSFIRSFVHFCSARHGPFSWMDRHRQIICIVLSGASNRLIPECISGLGPSRFDRRFIDVDAGDPILSSRFTMFADFVFCEVTVSKGTFFGIPIDTL